MANSRFGYVRSFEQPDTLLPNTYVVVRIDGKGFTKLTARYNFVKPNDTRGLGLMNAAAEAVMKELPDLVLAYGQSDEYSFVFPKDCQLFERRASKLTTLIVSVFTANYVFAWSTYFPDTPLTPPLPSFDGRAVCYPSELNVRDYLSWRQVDCHINNLFNTTFWALVQQGGMERRAAEQELSGTVASEKNEILFSRFGINYNNEPEIFKKGTVLYRDLSPAPTVPAAITTTTPAKTVQSPPPPLSHPQPKKLLPRPMSQPLQSTYPSLFQDTPPPMASDPTTPRGPTFLSTSTTPSPPPPARDMSMPTLSRSSPDKLSLAYPQTFFPVSPPSNGSASGSTSTMKSHLPSLTPIPLPPPTLKPSTRPPPSLSPPNPTSHTNFSPLPSPNPDTTQTSSRSKNAVSHSASASLSRPTTSVPSSRPLPKRSPSMSILNFSPPQIPIRISSIPLDAPTRKLSLPSSKSYSVQRAEEKENTSPGRTDKSRTPPLRTMKELPSPPAENDHVIRGAVMGSEPQEWTTSPTHPPQDRTTHSPPSEPPPRSSKRASSHSRLHSAPPSSSFFASTMAAADAILSPPLTSRDANADWPRRTSAANSASLSPTSTPQPPKGPQPPKKDRTPCSHTSTHHHIHHPQQRSSSAKKSGGKIKDHMEEDGGWLSGSAAGGDGRPVEKSKTQREKERKKKMKARVVAEHLDIIKDGFWEKRPWILKDGGVM